MRKIRTIEMQRLTLDEFKQAEKLPLVVILDDVRSMYNVGSVFRTCDAFRVESVYLCGISCTPPATEIHKTALGAEESVNWKYFTTALEAVESLIKRGLYGAFSRAGGTQYQTTNVRASARPEIRRSDGKRGEGCSPGGSRCLRRLFRDSPVGHEALYERVCNCRHHHL